MLPRRVFAVLILQGWSRCRDFHGGWSRRTADGRNNSLTRVPFHTLHCRGPLHRASSAASTTYRAAPKLEYDIRKRKRRNALGSSRLFRAAAIYYGTTLPPLGAFHRQLGLGCHGGPPYGKMRFEYKWLDRGKFSMAAWQPETRIWRWKAPREGGGLCHNRPQRPQKAAMSLRHYDVFAFVCRIQVWERRDRLWRLLSLRGEAGPDEGCEPGRA